MSATAGHITASAFRISRETRSISQPLSGAEDGGFAVQEGVDLAVLPDVVAGGNDLHASVEELISGVGGEAFAAGGVLAVGDDQVHAMALLDLR